jgi:NTP pyrophosphatase (non-canonical NTP hydrolase)
MFMIEVQARRVAAWRQKMEFITPSDMSDDLTDQCLVTYRDLLLVKMGEALVNWMHTTQSIGKESPEAMKFALCGLITHLEEIHDSIDGIAVKFENESAYVTHRDAMLGKLALIVEEIGEAADCALEGRERDFWTELADVYIRWCDIVGTAMLEGSDPHMSQIIAQKMETNEKRSIRHGKKKFL